MTGVNVQLMTQYGLNSNSYFWKKALWTRTTSSYARDVVSRPYPRLIGNQWNIDQNGNDRGGSTSTYEQYAAKYFAFVYLNRVNGSYSDIFDDTIDSTHNPYASLLMFKNAVYAYAATYGTRCYVLPYHRVDGVETNSPPETGYTYWFSQSPDNPWRTPANTCTWNLVSAHNAWYATNGTNYVPYPGYSTSQRRVFDQRIPAMQAYWAGHAYGACLGDGVNQFDGVFADNWLRSIGPDSSGWMTGVNSAGALLKSRWADDKILVGNGLESSYYNARDFGMIEDYSGNMTWDYSNSDAFSSAGQLAIDSSADTAWGDLWDRLARNLMTDDVFGINDTENGGALWFVSTYVVYLGTLGYPTEDRVNLGTGCYERLFTGGIAYWNDSGSNYTVNVPAGYTNISGATVSGNVVLTNHYGLILKTQ
jgi:hypothetical protein